MHAVYETKLGWHALVLLAIGGMIACATPEYTNRVAAATEKRAQYVESFAAPPNRVEQAVRSSLSDSDYQIVGTMEGKDATRTIKALQGEPGDPDSQYAYVVVRPDRERKGITTVYLDTQSATGSASSAKPVFEALKKRLAGMEAGAVASTSQDTTTGSGTNTTTSDDARESEEDGDAGLIEAVPQSSAYALVVGIEDYRDLPSPTGAAGDAERVARLLRDGFGLPESQIRTLVDEHATKSDIRAGLEWAASSVPEGGRIYLYYAGHGSPDPEEQTSLILPYEANQKTLRRTGLALDGVIGTLEDSKARAVVAFVDACFSGQGGRSVSAEGERPTVPVELVDEKKRGGSIVYAASKPNQVSGPNATEDGGLFTDFLLRGLGRGRADVDGDGQITVEELDTYVTPRVAREARKLSREQTPQLRVGSGASAGSLPLLWGLSSD